MDLNSNKKAFIFSFLALFISFLIIGYGAYKLSTNNYSIHSDFNKYRILAVDNEIKYFENIYLKDSLKYSTFKAMNQILLFSKDKTNYSILNKNNTMLNKLIYEAITNSSLNKIKIKNLENSSINKFIKEFKENFYNNYKGNFSFKLLNLSVYEKQPYYLTFQFLIKYNVTLLDNLSKWDVKKNIFISYPVYEMSDPSFIINLNKSIPVRPYSLYYSNLNWSFETLNQTINETYSTIFTQIDYKYTIGTSFLSRLLNISVHSYKDVLLFYTFDNYKDKYILDNALRNNNGKLYGESYLILNFDNNDTNDSTVYNNSAEIIGDTQINNSNVHNLAINLNGTGYLNISKDKFNLNFTNNISISVWINPKSYTTSSNDYSYIFSYGSNDNDFINIKLNKTGYILFDIGKHNGGSFHEFHSNSNISLNKYSNIIVSFNGNTGIGKIFINGLIDNLLADKLTYDSTNPIKNFNKSSINICIGNKENENKYFNGSLDELGVYSKILNKEEISDIFKSKRAIKINYKNSFHKRGVEFDGKRDYIIINSSNISNNDFKNNFTITTWIKPYDLEKKHFIISKYDPIKLYIDNYKLYSLVKTDSGWINLSYNINEINVNYFIGMSFNENSKKFKLYINGKNVNSTTISSSINIDITNDNPMYLGINNSDSSIGKYFFKGIIDEIKIYNRTLTDFEINENYFNYDSTSKGCCNYINLINPNSMGFNSSAYKKNVSYSSKLFFDHYFNNIYSNVSLWGLSNITSNETSKKYFNFLIDACLIQAYNLPYNDSVELEIRSYGEYKGSCKNLVKYGIY